MECFVRCSQLLHNFSVQTLNWKAVGEAAADDLCGDNRNGGASSGPFLISLTPIIRFSSCAYTHTSTPIFQSLASPVSRAIGRKIVFESEPLRSSWDVIQILRCVHSCARLLSSVAAYLWANVDWSSWERPVDTHESKKQLRADARRGVYWLVPFSGSLAFFTTDNN